MPTTSINRVRKAIAATVGSDRLTEVDNLDLLVQGGIISSLEIVMIGLELETEFGVAIPDNLLTVANFNSLTTLATLMDRLTGNQSEERIGQSTVEQGTYKKLQDSLANCLRRPLIIGLLVAFWMCLIDRVVLPYIIEQGPLAGIYAQFSDHGKRLYHSSGGWAPNDLQIAVRRHQFIKNPAQGGPRILFLGDSGTVGSWVKAEDAPPARTQEKLTKTFPQARVENFAFFTPSFVKDVMLLEAALEANDGTFPVDAVILTLSDSYFYSPFQKSLIELVPYISFNRALLKRFSDRLNASMYCETCQAIRESRTAGYIRLYDSLSKANRTHRSRFEEYVLEQTSIYRYKTFLTFLKLNVWDPDGFWQREYRIGDKPMFPTRLPKPPEKFSLNDAGFSAQTTEFDQVALINDVLDFLELQNIKVYIFLRPYAPVEWRDHPFPSNPMNVETLIHAQGWNKKATIIDLRWALHGDQFSDSLVHYTPAGSRVLGDAIGSAIAATWRPAPAAPGGSTK